MTAPTRLVWDLAGRPACIPTVAALLRDHSGMCVVCGESSDRTADVNRALGANFTDRSMFRGVGNRVCSACLWCCSGKPPATLRMWTIIAAPDVPSSQPKAFLQDTPGLCLTSRADTTPVIDTLANPPYGDWLVSVAVSGQKHVLPYATVNRSAGPWTVRMESTNVTGDPDTWRQVIQAAATLRAAGHRDSDILAGAPTIAACKTPADLGWWAAHSDTLRPYTGAPLLSLALWALTKGTTDDHATPRPENRDGAVGVEPAGLGLF